MTTDTQTEDRNVLNLDAFIPDEQFVVLRKVKHALIPPTVQMYLQVMKSRQRMKNADTDVEQMEQSLALIRLACPSIPENDVVTLPLQALNALAERIYGLMEDRVEGQDGAEGGSLGE